MKKILIIDNYDSFVYNLYQYIGEIEPNAEIAVFRNDKISPADAQKFSPTHIVISPGPGRPEDAGASVEIIKKFFSRVPLLGVCLGHQAIAYAFGGRIIHAKNIMHGKTSSVKHTETGIFSNVPNPFTATRYHSLVVDEKKLPKQLIITAKSDDDGEIMAIEHRNFPTFGVQFHPESILTDEGKNILKNFLEIKGARPRKKKAVSPGRKFSITDGLARVASGENLGYSETQSVMKDIMRGRATDAQVAGFLVALRMKGETGDEIAGMAKVMQENALRVRTFSPRTADTCGTGGDAAGTFNISTSAAFVVSAGGIPVAKHGNRSVSSRVGSADVLEAGGYVLNKTVAQIERELKETGFAFLFAPFLHPAMKNVMPARRQMKIRTAFNMLGPVVNPARVKYQIVGVFDFGYAARLAKALQAVGTKRALIVSGGFTDELTTCGENRAILVEKNKTSKIRIDIKKLGLHSGLRRELAGETDAEKAFSEMRKVLSGRSSRARAETVALNAGAVFWLTGKAPNLKDGVFLALDLIYSGKALSKLEEVMGKEKQ